MGSAVKGHSSGLRVLTKLLVDRGTNLVRRDQKHLPVLRDSDSCEGASWAVYNHNNASVIRVARREAT